MQTDPDTQLMLRFKAGDELAFHDLFAKYKKRVINYCYRFCGQQAVAEELAQESFLKVYRGAQRYRPTAKFSTWLFKIATNVCLNEIRKPVYRHRLESLDNCDNNEGEKAASMAVATHQQNPDDLLISKQQQRLVREAMVGLPDKQRAALLLRIEGEFSYEEIGQQISCSQSNVKSLIHRGRNKLKEALAAIIGGQNEESLPG